MRDHVLGDLARSFSGYLRNRDGVRRTMNKNLDVIQR